MVVKFESMEFRGRGLRFGLGGGDLVWGVVFMGRKVESEEEVFFFVLVFRLEFKV